MKAARSSRDNLVVGKRQRKTSANDATASRQRLSKRSKAKYSARELAGSLHRYAKGRPDSARVREFVRQEVSRAAAQEG